MPLDESSLTISNQNVDIPTMDYQRLRSEGIKHIEQMASQIWTDYNAHDPGVTILEQLCYAITDLGYRIEHKMEDLLAENGEDAYSSLYGPQDMLACGPVTILDLRKLVIDLDGVRNAWIESLDDQPSGYNSRISANRLSYQITTSNEDDDAEKRRNEKDLNLKGLYRVFVEAESQAQNLNVKRQVQQTLHANRNLCEDFESVKILEPRDISLEATLHIAPLAPPEKTLAAVYEAIEHYFSPRIHFYSLAERLNSGLSIDEIIDGPLLKHGFIDDEELEAFERRKQVRLSDLIHQVMQVEGILAVEHMAFSTPLYQGQWLIDIEAGFSPRLKVQGCDVTLVKNQFAVNYSREMAEKLNSDRAIAQFQSLRSKGDLSSLDMSPGEERSVGEYVSIQHHLPDIYGVNATGVPYNASPECRGRTRQLQAYLLFFDQLLANYFAQLSGVGQLLSFQGYGTTQTYFSQKVDDPELDLTALYRQDVDEAALVSSTENDERKNRFLDHLLARFGAQFTDYSLILFDPSLKVNTGQVILDKQKYLQNIPQLSAGRGQGYNYIGADTQNKRSGLENNIRCKLNIGLSRREDLVIIEHILLRPIPEDQQQNTDILVNAEHPDPYSLQITVAFSGFASRFSGKDMDTRRAFIEQQVREETPAHIAIKFLWLETQQAMDTLKATHNQWLAARQRFTLTVTGN